MKIQLIIMEMSIVRKMYLLKLKGGNRDRYINNS